MSQHDKPLVWLHGEVKTPPFTQQARIEAGVLLRRLQQNEKLSLPHSRPMDATKQKKLQAAGWRVGSAEDFLELSPEEAAYVEIKLALSRGLKHCRSTKKMTQTNLADKIGSSQSRIAKAEAGDPSVSIDLLVKAIFATGATPSDLARLINQRRREEAA